MTLEWENLLIRGEYVQDTWEFYVLPSQVFCKSESIVILKMYFKSWKKKDLPLPLAV